jgi:hypothetical protein
MRRTSPQARTCASRTGPELEVLTQDFAIFDGGTEDAAVVLFDYDSNGRVRGYRAARDQETMDRCREQYDLALRRSVPLGEFMAASLNL